MLSNLRKVMSGARDRGASAVEYGLMVAAIAAVIVAVVFGFGNLLNETFQGTSNCIEHRQTMPNCDPGEAATP
jgi:pilus assembly protein Flp/PilA